MSTDALTVLARCRDRGVELHLRRDQIKLTGDKVARDELRPEIVACKPALLALLREDRAPAAATPKEAATSGGVGYELVTSTRQLEVVAQVVAQAGTVALDIETTGLDPILHRPRLLQLGLSDGSIYIMDLWSMSDIGTLGEALATVTAVGHHLQFDLAFLKHHFGITVGQARCTMTAAQLIDGGVHFGHKFKGYFTLAAIADRHLGVIIDKELQKSDWSRPLTPQQLSYGADDVKHLLTLHDLLDKQLRENGLADAYNLECAVIPVVVDMALAGVGISRERWTEYVASALERTRTLEAQLDVEMPGVNPRSPKAILAALRGLGLDVASTSADALAGYLTIPAVAHLCEYRSVGSFVRGNARAVARAQERHSDGRVRASFAPLAAPTGRMSCSEPNLLGLPKLAEVRRCIEPIPGCMFVCADYAAIELRVLAQVTEDKNLLAVFRSNGDPHRATAASLLNKAEDEITKEERQRAKAVNFGFAFGMGVATFVEYAHADYGVVFSFAEARSFRDAYLQAYPGIAAWQKRMGRESPLSIRTGSGRLRRFPSHDEGYCARLNTPIQGTAADGMKKAMVLLGQRLPRLEARLILVVHDEVVVEAPVEVAEEVRSVVVTAMKEGMEEFVKSVPIAVEASIRRTWAENDVVERRPDAGSKLETP
jgi:DNA polymerase-1